MSPARKSWLAGVGPLFWLTNPPVLYGSRLLALVSSLAPVPPPVRSAAARVASDPYTCEPSMKLVTSLICCRAPLITKFDRVNEMGFGPSGSPAPTAMGAKPLAAAP